MMLMCQRLTIEIVGMKEHDNLKYGEKTMTKSHIKPKIHENCLHH